jgi:hypothetical protein
MPAPDPVEYVPVELSVVVEIETDTDTCFEVGRYRHPAKLLRVHNDLEPRDFGGLRNGDLVRRQGK